jgi:hypothetical protein
MVSFDHPPAEIPAVRRLFFLLILACLAALLVAPEAASQCAMCKEALDAQDASRGDVNVAEGFYYSILTMISIPAVLLAGLVSLIVINTRAQRAAAPPPSA